MKNTAMTNTSPSVHFAKCLIGMLFIPIILAGCASANYAIQERFGIEKRDILVDRVEDASQSQAEAKDEFVDALEAFRAVVNVDGGELEDTYDELSRAYDRAEDRADTARSRVASVKRVARDLFKEWEAELGEYSDAGLRRSSERQLAQTRERYEALAETMDDAIESMDPVLAVFNDRVLFLKHNLNARSIAALDAETETLENDVAELIAEMERSIDAADAFIQSMQT